MTHRDPSEDILHESESIAESAQAVAGPPPEPRKLVGSRARRIARNAFIAIPLILLVIWTVLPFLVTLSVSFKHKADVFANPGLIPTSPTLNAYREVLSSESFTTSFVNSVIVGTGTTFLTLLIGVPAAYAFARF